MKTPHINAEYIKAWADGNEVQWRRDWEMNPTEWANVDKLGFPGWDCATISFRVKPKPDVVRYAQIVKRGDHIEVAGNMFTQKAWDCDNVMFVFDGETEKLKDVQLLARE